MPTVTDIAGTFPDLGPKVAANRHPVWDLLQDEWIKLGDVREGTGGFKDGKYLIAHPREWEDHAAVTPKKPGKKLLARRAIARYDNLASAILEAKKAALFREQPNRRVGAVTAGKGEDQTELEQWWENVDGNGTHIDDAMPAWWDLAATFGHVVLYFELPSAETEPATAADQGTPYVRLYTPLDVLNWLTDDDGQIISLKVVEAVQAKSYQDLRPITSYRVRVIDEEGWRLYDYKAGAAISEGKHQLGRLPVAYLYGKRRSILTDVGQSVLGDPRNYIDLYNLTSELRELLRNQTFSFINLPLGSGQDAMSVTDAQALLGQQTGTMNVLFSGAAASILSGDAANVTAYQEEIKNLKRDIYRLAGVQWESDSKDAEAKGSLVLKREEMNTRLSAYADECELAEYRLAELWYRWKHGADPGVKKFEQDEVTIDYPGRFSATPFDEVLQQVQAAQTISMPALFLKEQRKALVPKFEGMANITPDLQAKINEAIDSAPDDLTPAQQVKTRMDATMAALDGKPMPKLDGAAPPKKSIKKVTKTSDGYTVSDQTAA